MIKRRSVLKSAVGLVIGVVLYSEWIVYLIQPLYWKMPQCSWSEGDCTKILFIADPQIQGEYSTSLPQRYLYNWDSDRYLRVTFNQVVKHFKPDILVFLGDVTDEGSVATSLLFDIYVNRLMHIFDVNYPLTRIWLPGDNDIGGEYEPIKIERILQFRNAFNQPEVVLYNNITFFTVNKIVYKLPKKLQDEQELYGNLRIALSHYSLTQGTDFDMKTFNNIRQDISFCGNDHVSKYKYMTRDFKNVHLYMHNDGDDILTVSFNNDMLYEIFVPTCSYRMGTSDIGYGAAVIGNNNENMEYSVLWSPKRFPLLFAYLVVVSCLILFYFIFYCVLVNLKGIRIVKVNSYSKLCTKPS